MAGVVGRCGGGTSGEIEGGWKEEVGSGGVIWCANSKCEKSLADVSFFSQIEHSVKKTYKDSSKIASALLEKFSTTVLISSGLKWSTA